VYINSGTGRFQEAAFLAGLSSSDWSWTPRLEDFDQDGHTDVFITNGVMRDNMDSDVSAYSEKAFTPGSPEYVKFWVSRPMRKENNLAFKNRRNLQFDSVGASWGLNHSGVSFGAATADFDGDGDPDLVVSNADRPVSLYRNHSHVNHRIAVKLIGKTSNRAGLGATIKLTSAAGIQTRAITSARGWLSASDTTALFGLGDSKMATRLEIVWPGGIRQQFDDLEADHLYSITEPVGQSPLPAKQGVPPIFTESTTLAQAVHRERPYDDFERQPLLPNKLSQLGPGCAWGDIDGDGDDDFFLGGAAGSPGQILLNLGNGTFQPLPEPALASDASSEDMGALFFDCDADGDLDLFVSHGGVEDPAAHPNYRDRLYLNDGQGSFSPAPPDRIPDLRSSSGPLAAADFDRDGDLDLFVGSRVVPGQYPHAPRDSYLLVNAGGNFSAVAIPALGMVTGALWSDADDDGWIDLMLTTEWGSVKFLKNVSGQLVDTSSAAGLDQQLGWWNGISAGDVDGDGDIDYLVSNLGLNTKYRASGKKPSLIYYGDLDGSGKSHIVEAKMGSGKILPRRGFSCSKNAMPSLQAKIGTYHNFASAALADLYTESRLSGALRLEVNMIETGLLLNDGQARFSWRALPRTAQISPSFGSALEDIDADGDLDAILAQNSFSPQRETGRMDGGLSLVLLNDGGGNFSPLTPVASGLAIPGDAQSLTISDLNDDGSPDLIFGMNGAAALSYVNNSDSRQTLSIRLAPNQNCRPAAGAKVRVGPQIRELYAGGGYLSQSSSQLYFRQPEGSETATVRWPDGSRSRHPIPIGTSSIVLEQPPPE
ncbi:MAG: FG-GAP-like repeat-containing protein, partial [Verrucomicrobiales bacterium]